MSKLIVCNVESDGPVPGKYSMVCFGAVVVEPEFREFNSGLIKPISNEYDPKALSISGFTRQQQEEAFLYPLEVMRNFADWLKSIGERPIFMSDNVVYDGQWMNFYFHTYYGSNPFGYSGRRIGDLYCGMVKDMRASWKHLRDTKHTHNPVDDARGNAEVVMKMFEMGLKR